MKFKSFFGVATRIGFHEQENNLSQGNVHPALGFCVKVYLNAGKDRRSSGGCSNIRL